MTNHFVRIRILNINSASTECVSEAGARDSELTRLEIKSGTGVGWTRSEHNQVPNRLYVIEFLEFRNIRPIFLNDIEE